MKWAFWQGNWSEEGGNGFVRRGWRNIACEGGGNITKMLLSHLDNKAVGLG